MSDPSTVRIGLMLPDVLGTSGDGGNALVLRERLERRGYPAEIVRSGFDEPVPQALDLYALGGGEDSAQRLAARHMTAHPGLQRAVGHGAPVLAVCAAMQVLGAWFTTPEGSRADGLGILDATSTWSDTRSVGEITADPLVDGLTDRLSGFVNHAGRTVLGPGAQPLARVARGPGNTDAHADAGPSVDGAVQGSVLATYMHGPVLARNPQLADLLIARALNVAPSELAPLEMPAVDALRRERLSAR